MTSAEGTMRPALCYIAPGMEPSPPDSEYVDRIVEPARRYGFPDWYIARLEEERVRPTNGDVV